MNKYTVLIGLLIVMLTVGVVGPHLGLTSDGVPVAVPALGSESDWHDADYGWDVIVAFWSDKVPVLGVGLEALTFIFLMSTFQIDGAPAPLAVVFLFMDLVTVFLLYGAVRGTE